MTSIPLNVIQTSVKLEFVQTHLPRTNHLHRLVTAANIWKSVATKIAPALLMKDLWFREKYTISPPWEWTFVRVWVVTLETNHLLSHQTNYKFRRVTFAMLKFGYLKFIATCNMWVTLHLLAISPSGMLGITSHTKFSPFHLQKTELQHEDAGEIWNTRRLAPHEFFDRYRVPLVASSWEVVLPRRQAQQTPQWEPKN